MAEVEQITIDNLEAGQAATDQLKNAIQKLEVTRQTAAGSFSVLKSVTPDLGSKFIEELNGSLDDIYKFLKENLLSSAEEYFIDNDPTPAPVPEPEDPGDDPAGGGNNGSGSGVNPYSPTPGSPGSPVTPNPDTPSTIGPQTIAPITLPPDTTAPGTDPSIIGAIVLEDVDTSSLQEMPLDDLDSLIDEMVELADKNKQHLDEFLEDDENSDRIKEMLLKSPFVPQAFKEIIADLDSSIVRLLLDYILKGNSPEVFDLNTLNLGIVYSILEETAKENGISVQELLSNPKYTDLLRDKLGSFDNVIDLIKGWEDLSNEDFQDQLKSFYYGDVSNEFPDEDILTTRAYVDYLAEACDVYYEDLLNDASYAETLKEGAVQFGKALTFFKASSFFTDDGMRSNVSNMLNGNNYKAFGMTEENVNSFRSEIDSLAKANNTTADKLLSDSQYADTVKESLNSSDSAKGVGMIYKNAESSVSQEVAKNLYNTSFEESPQQKEINEIAQKAAKEINTKDVKVAKFKDDNKTKGSSGED